MQGQMYEVKCEQKKLTQTKALAAEMSAIIIPSFFGGGINYSLGTRIS